MELEKIIECVNKKLSEKRFYHSKCVMERCIELAKKFNIDTEVAAKVGIAHDIAKEMTPEEKLKYVKKNNIKIDEIERENTTLLHAKIGASIVIKDFNFTEKMAQSILVHTTGIENMTMLDKILFISDRTSKDREFPDIEYLDNLLNEDINKAVLYILDKKIELQIKKKQIMHPNSIIARNYLLKNDLK